MAEVFLASFFPWNPSAQSVPLFAIKRLLPRYSASKPFVQRLIAEAKLATLLNHPNLLGVDDLGTHETDFFLKMDWVNGKGLDQLIHRARSARQRIPLSLAIHIINEIAVALDALHTARDGAGRPLDLIHCDVTPQNILISYDGDVKLTDFGIAMAHVAEKGPSTDIPLGKLPYMAPEQIQRKTVSHQIDLYSLGIIFFELVSGEQPFEATSSVELQQKIVDAPPPLNHPFIANEPEVSEQIQHLLEKDPKARLKSAHKLLSHFSKRNRNEGKAELTQWMADSFASDRRAEEARRESGIVALKEEPLPADDLLASVPRDQGLLEKTDPAEKETPPTETRVAFKKPLLDDPAPVGKVGLVKKPVIKEPEPVVTEATSSSPETSLPPPEAEVLYESSTPGITLEEVSVRDIEISAPVFGERPPEKPDIPPVDQTRATDRKIPLLWIKRLFLGLSGFVLVCALLFLIGTWISSPSKGPDLPIEKIEIFVSLEGPERKAHPRSFNRWKRSSSRLGFWQEPLEAFFASEYRRHTGQTERPFALIIRSPLSDAPPIHWAGSLFNKDLQLEELTAFFQLPEEVPQTNTARLFVHLYPKSYDEQHHYPLDLASGRPHRQGIVYIPVSPKEDVESRVRLAHEIAHAMGAKDKYDKRGLPSYPEGFIDPLKDPLYPQTFGELMTRGIPETEESYIPFVSLGQIRIGETTAAEIGWIEKKR